MVAIPKYNENKIPVDNTPMEYMRVNNNPDAFGAGIAQAQERLSENSMMFSKAMIDLHKSIQQTKALELSNYIDKLEREDLSDPNNGYYSKLGKDAMADPEDPTKGANAVLNSIDKKIMDKQKELGLTWGYGYKTSEYIKTKKMDMLYRGATAHEIKQTQNWATETRQETTDLAISKGILHRDNEEDMATALANGKVALIANAKISHWDEDTTRIAVAQFESQFHSGIIRAYAEDGSLKIKDYYEKHKDQLLPKDQQACLSLMKDTEIKYIAEDTANRLFNTYPEDEETAYAELDKIDNIRERDAIESRLNSKYARKRSIENHQQDQLLDQFWNNVDNKIKNGEVPSEDDIPLGLNGRNNINARNAIDQLITKGDTDTDNSTYLDLYELSTTDAQAFAKLNLAPYRANLSAADYKAFQKRQVDIKNMTPTQLADDDAAIKAGLKSLGYTYSKKGQLETSVIGGHTQKKAAAYKNTFNAYIRELELAKGKNLTRDEINSAEKEFAESYKANSDKYIEGMNHQVGFMRNVINDLQTAEKAKGSGLTSEEKTKIIANRVSKTAQNDNAQMANAIKQSSRTPRVGDTWQGHTITSVYGQRTRPTAGASTNHQGIDLAYRANEKITPFASGKVINVVYNNKGYGNYIDIQSGDGTVHRYAHCNSIIAKKGEYVNTNTYIARAGNTGVATGPHLHYEQIKNGRSVDPFKRNTTTRIAEGTVVRNPKTGQRLVMRGGKWQQI